MKDNYHILVGLCLLILTAAILGIAFGLVPMHRLGSTLVEPPHASSQALAGAISLGALGSQATVAGSSPIPIVPIDSMEGILAAGEQYISPFSYTTTIIHAPHGNLMARVAMTEAEREQGLSDVNSMASSSGMLFVFDSPDKYGFWMKDMRFPLTIVWIDSNKQIIGFTRHAYPYTYPEIYYPPGDIMYALEINIGIAGELGMATGTILRF